MNFGYAYVFSALFGLAMIASGSPAVGSDDRAPPGFIRPTSRLAAGTVGRYLVTYLKSNTSDPLLRSASIITVTNSNFTDCVVSVDWRFGAANQTTCTTSLTLARGDQVDFCSRALPSGITSCNIVCAPELTLVEGRSVVGSSNTPGCDRISVSARTIYTSNAEDKPIDAITDSKVVDFTTAKNAGD